MRVLWAVSLFGCGVGWKPGVLARKERRRLVQRDSRSYFYFSFHRANFRFQLIRKVPRLTGLGHASDDSVFVTLFYKVKEQTFLEENHVFFFDTPLAAVTDWRPHGQLEGKARQTRCDCRQDYVHYNETTIMAFRGGFDEKGTPEDNHSRLQTIAGQTGRGWKRTFYVRVVPYLDNTLALFHVKDEAKWQVLRTHTK